MSHLDYRWENWASDFADSFAARALNPSVKDYVSAILTQFGVAVSSIDPEFPDEVRSGTFAKVLTETMPRLSLDDHVRPQIPDVVATFLEFLQDEGKLGDGNDWAAQVRIIGRSFQERLKPGGGVKGVTIRRPEGVSSAGRNDPCPCGSGKKYKKCCTN